MREAKIEVHGRVQGVNFRNMVRRFCEENELTGYVQNNEDGSVLIVAQGSDENLKSLFEYLEGNPGLSKVEKMNKTEYKCEEAYEEFRVVRENSLIQDQRKAINNLGKRIINH